MIDNEKMSISNSREELLALWFNEESGM